jgi:hypothetical protein
MVAHRSLKPLGFFDIGYGLTVRYSLAGLECARKLNALTHYYTYRITG